MSRVLRSPVVVRDTTSTPSDGQQLLLFVEPTPQAKAIPLTPHSLTPTAVQKLWFCIYLPHLPLEACRTTDEVLAIVEEQHGIHRILQADQNALSVGIMPGQSANAALALLPTLKLEERSLTREKQVLELLASWLERFSSFVNIADKNVLLLEIAGSLRLFGGLPKLREEVSKGLRKQGFSAAMAIAPTPLAATWLARASVRSGRRACIRAGENLAPALRELPLECLAWPQGQRETLAGMGISTVGECLRLPREGFARRFGAKRLLDLDRALGSLPDPRDSWRTPERFCADHEMLEEQSDRELLLNVCRELLLSHEQFLLARQLGTQRIRVSFYHLKNAATDLQLGSAVADRSATRWFDLLKIRFDTLHLPEPVIAIRLQSGLPQALQAETEHLYFAKQNRRYSIGQLIERLIARIGEASVHAMGMVAEHRPEYAWSVKNPLTDRPASTLTTMASVKRPLWMLPEPIVLSMESGHPLYRGSRLTFLGGPERLETGWWDGEGISRDYYAAADRAGMHLWVFRNRQQHALPHWYLHGIFG